ncbi:hypothetical protein OH77DRAFT_1587031 [Trametes cingulata]|nr:hypothetical protein OH77DRAFT_1587031 [Trametes cingulata]
MSTQPWEDVHGAIAFRRSAGVAMAPPSYNDSLAEVTRILHHLGGPRTSAEELEWAQDIPAGKQLLEWLPSQNSVAELDLLNSVNERLGHMELTEDALCQTVLSPIALHQDEIHVSERISQDEAVTTCSSRLRSDENARLRASYAFPSSLRARAEVLEHEADALEKRSARLQHRLGFTKSGEKDLKHTISISRKQIQESDLTIKEAEAGLTDLSTECDDVVAQSARQSLKLLENNQQQGAKLSGLKAQVASLDRARAAVADAVARLYQSLDDEYSSLRSHDELERDASSLRMRLGGMPAETSQAAGLISASYVGELESITRQLGSRGQGDPRQAAEVLHGLETPDRQEKGSARKVVPDVKTELERAGRWDRFLLLEVHERELADVSRRLQDDLLPRMQRTYDALHERSAVAAESEALISALIEELEDVNDTVESTKNPQPSLAEVQPGEDPDYMLESAVTELLKSLHRSRSDHNGRPTVLLNRSDVDAELGSLAEGYTASQSAEERWAAGIKDRLSSLRASCMPLVSAAYDNAPMNTSAPFAPPRAETEIIRAAQRKGDELTEAAARLQKYAELNNRDKRKLAAFIEKWA